MNNPHMDRFHEMLRELAIEATDHLPEGKDRSNGKLMILCQDLQEQLHKISRAAAECRIDKEFADKLYANALAFKAEQEHICSQISLHLPREGVNHDVT